MVTKIIACADLHFKNDMANIEHLIEVTEAFCNQCKEIVKNEGDKNNVRIAIAGDIFESKLTASNEALAGAAYFLRNINEIAPVVICAGNHDLSKKNLERLDTISAVLGIGDFPNIKYIDQELEFQSGCYIDDNIIWCLYSTFDSFNRPNIEQITAQYPDKVRVGLIHGDIAGAASRDYTVEHGIELTAFKGLDFVIAGHIHKYQSLRRGRGCEIVYCSSLMQQHFGENVSNHGFVLWDVETKKHTFIETPNEGKRFWQISINSLNDLNEDTERILNP